MLAALFLVVIFGAWLRLSGANWDRSQHLHPDDRYVSAVADNIRWPSSPLEYFDVHDSPLSPYNGETGRHYVYGLLPLFATKLAATAIGREDFDRLNIVGRRLSGLLDTASILLVFLIGRLLLDVYGSKKATEGALVAAALYAVVVAAIQAGHFFTMESWLVFFTLLTFYLAARMVRSAAAPSSSRFQPLFVAVGASLGLTVACKVSGGLVAIPILVALLGQTALQTKWAGLTDAWLRFCTTVLTILVAGYAAYRTVSPYSFANSNWFDLSINHYFRSALAEQQDLTNGKSLYPPLYQWLLSPRVWSPFENLFVWQVGIPLGVVALGGLVLIGVEVVKPPIALARRRSSPAGPAPTAQAAGTIRLMLLAFVLASFFYFSSRFAHFGRYLLPLVPFLPLAAVYLLVGLFRNRRAVFWTIASLVFAATAAYALSFRHIYAEPNTRVAASDWIVEHVPAGKTLANEHWDDSLPVGGAAQPYKLVSVPVFEPDDGAKLRKLYDALAPADYYFLSSPRAWKTIGRLPDRFPLMVRFYRLLFAGRVGFERAVQITSEPELFGVRLHDGRAEEAWWVYDHPPVNIFRRTKSLSWKEFRGLLCERAECPQGRTSR